MIEIFFGFTKNPFSKTVADKDIFMWKEFENLTGRLNYFINNDGIFLLTGSIGSGKTTALKLFSTQLNPNKYRVVYVCDTFNNKRDFYRSLLRSFDMIPPFHVDDARSMLKKHILECFFVKKIMPLIIFDEAQNMPGFIFEEIRLLSIYDYDSLNPVSFILSGHNLLKQRFANHENEALNQRVTLKYHISGMSLNETCSYITQRLTQAGSTSAIFNDSTFNKIHLASGGIPRLVNKICTSLLLSAVVNNKKIIDDLIFDQTTGEWE